MSDHSDSNKIWHSCVQLLIWSFLAMLKLVFAQWHTVLTADSTRAQCTKASSSVWQLHCLDSKILNPQWLCVYMFYTYCIWILLLFWDSSPLSIYPPVHISIFACISKRLEIYFDAISTFIGMFATFPSVIQVAVCGALAQCQSVIKEQEC